MRILTLNMGMLRFVVGGKVRWESPPYGDLRLGPAVTALAAAGARADVIALQEVYQRDDLEAVREALLPQFSHAFYGNGTSEALGQRAIGHGLAVFSRWPLAATATRRLEDADLWRDRLPGHDAYLAADVEVPGFGRLRLANVHLTAGDRKPGEWRADPVRQAQIEQLAREAWEPPGGGAGSVPGPRPACCCVVGDLNAGPESSPGNYGTLLQLGWRDVVRELLGAEAGPTWDPNGNPLAGEGEYSMSKSARIDHVLLQGGAGVHAEAADILFKEPVVDIGGGRRVPISDHYGVLVTLAFTAGGRA